MKQCQKIGIIGFIVASLLIPLSVDVAAGGKAMVEPIFTRYARIYEAPTLDFRTEFFKDKPMEEATDFDGYSLFLDFTWPINDRSQVQVFLPFYTNGDATYDNAGRFDGVPIDIEGYNGVRDFFSLIYERRFSWLEGVTGVNVAWLAGIGWGLDPLEVTTGSTLVDRFNHSGSNTQIGLKFDDDIRGGNMTLLGNLRLIMYRDTDDITLSEGSGVNFNVLSATGAVMFNRYGRFTPVLEALFEADFEDYTAFSLAPELIYTLTDDFDVKLAVPFRLTSDGQKYAANLELTYRF